MRIAQIAPIAERVPPEKYGGTERVISTLTEQLVKRGHEVTLFASGDSKTAAKLQSVFPVSLRQAQVQDLYGFNIPSMKNMGLAYAMHGQFDIIHDHNPHLSLPTANICPTPVVATWHGPYFPEVVEYFRLFPHVNLVSISQSQALAAPTLQFCANVYNGLVLDQSPFSAEPQGYLLYVGRIDREKGTHVAIDVAVRLKKKLIIAGKLDDAIPHIREYYVRYVRPRLKRHADLVTWIGEVGEVQRNDLMKNSLCLLHPISWPEPFGLTLIESMACGAPVIAFRLGSIPEVIQDGRTGFVVDTLSEMAAAVGRLGQIDRRACREYALSRFNAERMADGYEAVYQKILQAKQTKGNQ